MERRFGKENRQKLCFYYCVCLSAVVFDNKPVINETSLSCSLKKANLSLELIATFVSPYGRAKKDLA